MKQLKEVCAYIRVSTGKQEELSPDSQLRLIKEYAQAHDMLLTHVYMEEHGISGKSSEKRPAFQEMIAACKDKSHPYDAVLLWKFSRFARNQDEATYYKSILRKKCNVDVISISEPIIEGMYGRLIEMVIEWSDEFYLVNLSGEVMRGMTQNALNGGYNSNPPIGYTKKRGEIPQVDPERAELVRRIFRMFTEQHMSRNDIASTLNRQGITTNRGGRWETRTVTYILENPFYIGKIRWNFYDRSQNRRKDTGDVILSDGQHEPIISADTFAAAGRLLAKARTTSSFGRKRSVVATKHWLSSMVLCSSCGASLGYNKGGQKKHAAPFFQCWKHIKGMCDHNSYISAAALEQMVMDAIIHFGQSFDLMYHFSDAPQADDAVYLTGELSKLSEKERRIKDAYISGIDSLEEYRENKALLQKKRDELEQQLADTHKVTPIKERYQQIDMNHLLTVLQDPDQDYIVKGNSLRKVFDHFVYDKEAGTLDCFLNTSIEKISK